MEFCDASIREFFPTLRTTQKSKLHGSILRGNQPKGLQQDPDCKYPQPGQMPMSALFNSVGPSSQPWDGEGYVAENITSSRGQFRTTRQGHCRAKVDLREAVVGQQCRCRSPAPGYIVGTDFGNFPFGYRLFLEL